MGDSETAGLQKRQDNPEEEHYAFEQKSITWIDKERFAWHDPPAIFLQGTDSSKRTRNDYRQLTAGKKTRWHFFSRQPRQATAYFTFSRCGDLDSASLFYSTSSEKVADSADEVIARSIGYGLGVTPREILDAIKDDAVLPGAVYQHFLFADLIRSSGGLEAMGQFQSNIVARLQALAIAAKLYSHLPKSTVALRIVTYTQLLDAFWVLKMNERLWKFSPFLSDSLSRSEAFACIAMFESGGLNFHPSDLERVYALSTADSIYVTAPILCDPGTDIEPGAIRRVIGNIGRAGLAFLFAPSTPRVPKPELESYHLIDHAPFD